MKIQYISDIHLELRTDEELLCPISKDAEILVLAGDIGDPKSKIYFDFLIQCSKTFNHVILILGNHEYYGSTISQTEKIIREFVLNYPNIHFLQNSSIEIEGTIFYGCTLWTHIPTNDINMVQRSMGDYRYIYDEFRNLITPAALNELHWSQLGYMIEFLDHLKMSHNLKPIIIVTHHCPIMTPDTLKKGITDHLTIAFHNELEDLLTEYREIKAWIYGHTHHPCDTICHDVRIVSNPCGYPGELYKDKNQIRQCTVCI